MQEVYPYDPNHHQIATNGGCNPRRTLVQYSYRETNSSRSAAVNSNEPGSSGIDSAADSIETITKKTTEKTPQHPAAIEIDKQASERAREASERARESTGRAA